MLMTMITAAVLQISSSAFNSGDRIPARYTCEGQNINPPISIGNIPGHTKTLALIVEDPDAPKGTFDHWVTWNIPPDKTIPEAGSIGVEGSNGFGKKGYGGPCPPAGSGTHHYHFHVYALDTELNLPAGADKGQLRKAMKDHILGEGELIGLYRHGK